MRTWVRYFVPLTLVAVIAMLPFVWIGTHVPVPADVVQARSQMKLGWELCAIAWVFQLWLVGAAAPLVRDPSISQLRAVMLALVGLGRAAVPVGVAVLAILVGCAALVIPGLVLLVVLSLSGASPGPLPGPLTASIAVAHRHLKQLVILVAVIVLADLAIAAIAHLTLLPKLPPKAPLALIAPARTFVRIIAFVLVGASSLPAALLATFKVSRE